jgi:transposase-like protein
MSEQAQEMFTVVGTLDLDVEKLLYEEEHANDEDEWCSDSVACPACGSDVAVLLGQLGHLVHYRCRACGMDFSHDVTW